VELIQKQFWRSGKQKNLQGLIGNHNCMRTNVITCVPRRFHFVQKSKIYSIWSKLE